MPLHGKNATFLSSARTQQSEERKTDNLHQRWMRHSSGCNVRTSLHDNDTQQQRGAMDKSTSESVQVEISPHVKDILCALIIDNWQSEPNRQHKCKHEHKHKHKTLPSSAFMWMLPDQHLPEEASTQELHHPDAM